VIYKVIVPDVGEDVQEIRVLEWHGGPGDRFEPGALIVELETHKALVEMRAAQDGVLRRILAPEGEWAKIGVPIAMFSDDPGEPLPDHAGDGADLIVEFVVD
jgi:pyruvate/2-oxoglutarate dehydrogenase complex dihydrolipoamide acyltransferase (E2) component